MIGRAWLTLLAYYLVAFGNCSEVLLPRLVVYDKVGIPGHHKGKG